jgi:RNA polymerase sigma-70 factor, ECF subfamily
MPLAGSGHRSATRRGNGMLEDPGGVAYVRLFQPSSSHRGRPMTQSADVTELLLASARGDAEARDHLMAIVYDELRGIARRQLRHERSDHTLQATALVNEAYLKLVKLDRIQWQNRAHFFAIAAQAIRRVLVDHATARRRKKRGGEWQAVSLEEAAELFDVQAEEMLGLDDALRRLEAIYPRQARVVECRFFGGLSIEETAAALDISPRTVKRDWELARAWLFQELSA